MKKLIAILVACAAPLAGQTGIARPIDTDRPDFTDGTHTVARGHIQFETGYSFQRSRGTAPGHTHSLPEALLRYGLSSRVELRLGENYLVQRGDGVGAGTVRGFDDIYIGSKISLTDAHGAVPALSMEVKANLPTGSAGVSAERWLPGAAVLFGWETETPWSLGVELLVQRAAGGNSEGIGSMSVQYQATPKVQFYGEYIGARALGSNSTGSSEHVVNSGVLVLLNQNVQVDARIGTGLNDRAGGYLFGFGFAVRR